MTRSDHENGTERLAEVLNLLAIDDQLVVNMQGDEPFIPAENTQQVAVNLHQFQDAKMATLSATIPYDRKAFIPAWKKQQSLEQIGDHYQRHIGVYAYRSGSINEYLRLSPSAIECLESLEQLRLLWHGYTIDVGQANAVPPAGIDTPENLQNALKKMKKDE